VQSAGGGGIFVASDRSAHVEDGDHEHHEQKAHARTKLIPMGGDEEDDAAGQ